MKEYLCFGFGHATKCLLFLILTNLVNDVTEQTYDKNIMIYSNPIDSWK